MEQNKDKFSGESWKYAGVGFEVSGSVGLFCLIGYFVDRHWGTYPMGILIGAIVGIIVGLYLLIKESLTMNRSESTKDRDRNREK
ncbi:MAG: AtpZ/AtpI family protein [Phycisphaerae bacterium]